MISKVWGSGTTVGQDEEEKNTLNLRGPEALLTNNMATIKPMKSN
jgi:hypothetical protein